MKTPKVVLRTDFSRVCGKGILLGVSKYCNLFTNWELDTKPPFYLSSSKLHDNTQFPENWLADAFITDSTTIPESVQKAQIPVIGIHIQGWVPGAPNIVAKSQQLAEIAFEYFKGLGFTQYAYCGFEEIFWAVERGECFRKLILNNNSQFKISIYGIENDSGYFVWDKVNYQLSEWLKQLPYPTALFACNDDCAKLISSACKTAKIRVPEDISILGVDNDEVVCLTSYPPLSSIALDFEKAGFEAAKLLDSIMKKKISLESQQTITINPIKVVPRRSTDFLAINDAEVVNSLEFIRLNMRKNINVEDVVNNSSISRRALEYRFRKVLGNSIYNQIRRIRVEQICSMLIETNLSISQIAHEFGLVELEHFSRYFRAEKGISPNDFRKKHRNISQ